jgi:hypothetical protein
LIPELEEGYELMRDGVEITEELSGATMDLALAEQSVGDSARWATASLLDLYNAADPSRLSDFGEGLEKHEFVELGGTKIQQFGDDLEAAWQLGTMSAEEHTKELEKGFVAQQALSVAMGDTTAWKAAQVVADQLKIAPGEARDLVSDLDGALQALDQSEFTIYIDVITRGGDIGRLTGGAPGLGKMDILEGRAKGGQLGKGWSMVGEEGFEIVSPTGYVFTNEESKALLAGGVRPGDKFLMGGEFEGDWDIPDTVTNSTVTTASGARPRRGKRTPGYSAPIESLAEEVDVQSRTGGHESVAGIRGLTASITSQIKESNNDLLAAIQEQTAQQLTEAGATRAFTDANRRGGI